MLRIFSSLVLLLAANFAQASCVILLHGLWRSPDSLSTMQMALNDAGFETVNQGYPSRDFDVETLADLAIDPALKKCSENSEINFVTHSLGGILVRQYLKDKPIKNLNRVVMLGPPNKGSEVVDTFGDVYGFEWFNGPAGLQLGTAQSSKPNQLGAVDFELGVIAGDRSINLILSEIIPGQDDGKVSIENTKVDGMSEHVVMPVNHATMMNNKEVIGNVISFLNHGNW